MSVYASKSRRRPVRYVPGYGYPSRSVIDIGQIDVTREYRCPIPRASTRNRSQRVTTDWFCQGILAVLTVGALGMIGDGITLMLIARWQ